MALLTLTDSISPSQPVQRKSRKCGISTFLFHLHRHSRLKVAQGPRLHHSWGRGEGKAGWGREGRSAASWELRSKVYSYVAFLWAFNFSVRGTWKMKEELLSSSSVNNAKGILLCCMYTMPLAVIFFFFVRIWYQSSSTREAGLSCKEPERVTK